MDFKVFFSDLLIKNWLNSIDFNQKEIEIILKLWSTVQFFVIRFESDRNRGLNPDGLESESAIIWFGRPNCLSLLFLWKINSDSLKHYLIGNIWFNEALKSCAILTFSSLQHLQAFCTTTFRICQKARSFISWRCKKFEQKTSLSRWWNYMKTVLLCGDLSLN